MADRVVQPWWYDVSLGVLMEAVVSSYSTRSALWIGPGLRPAAGRLPGPPRLQICGLLAAVDLMEFAAVRDAVG